MLTLLGSDDSLGFLHNFSSLRGLSARFLSLVGPPYEGACYLGAVQDRVAHLYFSDAALLLRARFDQDRLLSALKEADQERNGIASLRFALAKRD